MSDLQSLISQHGADGPIRMLVAVVCGGRTYSSRDNLYRALDAIRPTRVIHGGARGADQLAGEWAVLRGVPVQCFPADWEGKGKAAGFIRNQQMLQELLEYKVSGLPVVCVAFPGGRGTEDMVNRCTRAEVHVHYEPE